MNLSPERVAAYNIPSGRYIQISVADTGVGMDAETRQRIFDPFFTTKEVGTGTGLGLASAYGIISNHQGIIEVDSDTARGTTFTIFLPASPLPAVPRQRPPAKRLRGHETLLLVDDEEMVLSVASRMLQRLGYTVRTARSGREALEIYRREMNGIALVMLDMIMPIMSGHDLFICLKEINPNIKTLLSSGYSIDGQAAEILKRGCNGFIQKPFTLDVLSQKIREILDGR